MVFFYRKWPRAAATRGKRDVRAHAAERSSSQSSGRPAGRARQLRRTEDIQVVDDRGEVVLLPSDISFEGRSGRCAILGVGE